MDATTTFAVDATLDLLARTPATLRDQLRGLDADWTTARSDPESWNAFEVACHLAYIEEHDWLVRVRMVVDEGTARAFPPVDHGDASFRYPGWSLDQVLGRFEELRRRNLDAVSALGIGPDLLDRRGLHPTLGEVSLRQLLATWAVHDLNHLRQAQAAIAQRYRDEVGPWRGSLGILDG